MLQFCPDCGASRGPQERHCTECGREFAGRQGRRDRRVDAIREPGRAHDRHRHAVHAGRRAITRLQLWLLGFAAFNGLVALSMTALLRGLGTENLGMAAVLVWLPAVACLVGAVVGPRNPLPWALAVACMQTLFGVLLLLGCILEFLADGAVHAVSLGLAIVPTIGSWQLTLSIARYRRVVRDHPDSPSLTEPDPREVQRQRARRRSALRATLHDFRTAAILFVGFAVVLIGGRITYLTVTQPKTPEEIANEQPDEPLEPVLQRFAATWDAADVATIVRMLPEKRRRTEQFWRERFERRGMLPKLPPLGRPDVENFDRMAKRVRWLTTAGEIQALFRYQNDQWSLDQLVLPER